MKKRKPYTMSEKRITKDMKQANLENWIEVVTLRNQGWTFEQIGKEFGYSKQFAEDVHERASRMTIQQLHELRLRIDNMKE